ncbi:MAG TPA: ribosomal subunit interface protein, partial [Sphingomonas sp.]
NSPSSNVMPDDIEVYARCQEGLATDGGDWVSLHREAGRDKADGNGRYTAGGLSEMPMRNQYRAWAGYMTKEG